jgi:hypothetical protein
MSASQVVRIIGVSQQHPAVKNLNVRSETVKLLQEKLGNTLEHIGISNNFMNELP